MEESASDIWLMTTQKNFNYNDLDTQEYILRPVHFDDM